MRLLKKIRYGVFFLVLVFLLFFIGVTQYNKQKFNHLVHGSFFDGKDFLYKEFVSRLERSGIEYKLGKNYMIYYTDKNPEAVRLLLSDVLSNNSGDPGVYIENELALNDFLSLLKANSIPFERRMNYLYNEEWVRWDKQYNEEVSLLLNKITKKNISSQENPYNTENLRIKSEGMGPPKGSNKLF